MLQINDLKYILVFFISIILIVLISWIGFKVKNYIETRLYKLKGGRKNKKGSVYHSIP